MRISVNFRPLYLPLMLLLTLGACGSVQNPIEPLLNSLTSNSIKEPTPIANEIKTEPVKPNQSVGSLDKLLALPELDTLVAQYESADARYRAVKASQGFTVSGSSDLGARNQENDEFVATASVIGQKSLNIQSENDLTLKILAHQRDMIKIQVQSAIDKIFGQVMAYELSNAHLQKMQSIADKYRKIYQENKPALDAAISAGIVNSSESFKFRKTLANYDRRLHEASAANALLRLNVRSYNENISSKYIKIGGFSGDEIAKDALSQNQLPEVEKLKLQLAILRAEQALIETQKKPLGSVISRLTTPTSSDEDLTAFVGVSFTLPMFDNGEKDLLIDEKILQTDGVEAALDAYLERNSDSRLQLKRYLADAEITLAMLEEEQTLTNEIIDDLKTRLGYGGANISDLVSEMMALAELELQVADKEHQIKTQILDYVANYGISCSLTQSCDVILGSIKQFEER
jgi:citrate lyase gamma subunit